VSVRTTGRLRLEPIGPEHAHDVWLERIGMTYAGEIRWRGDVEGQTEQQDAAPFAVCVTQLTAS
jgi:hypothetical protein